MSKKLKVGIAGYGVVGRRRQHYIDMRPDMHVTAICDQTFELGTTQVNGLNAYNNYQDLLQKEAFDILFVCLPNNIAAEVTIAGLHKGLHVFCEKPPGRNVGDIESVQKVEVLYPHLVLKYGFNHRFHDSVLYALNLIQSGKYGDIINLRGVYGKSRVIPFSGGWRANRELAGGGILLDQGIHMLDLMRLFCGDFTDVKSFISNSYWHHDVEDNAYALLRDAKGRVAMLNSSATQWQHRFRLDITLKEGFIELYGILSGSKSYGEEKIVFGPRDDESNNGGMERHEIQFLEDNSWRDEIAEFAQAIANGTKVKYGTSQDALDVMKLVYRIYFADETWRNQYNIPNPDAQ